MNEINYSEIDVDQLMNRIREAVTRRGIDVSVASEPLSAPSLEALMGGFRLPVQSELPRLNLSAEFQPRSDDCYHVNDLLKYHGSDFVLHAYQAILKRDPDEKGYRHNIEMLRNGSFNKIDIMASLRFSAEGERTGVRIYGLRLPYAVRRLGRVPVLGYFVQLAVGLGRLPVTIRNQRQFEAYVLTHQSQIVDHFQRQGVELSRRLQQQQSDALTQLQQFFRDLSELKEALIAGLDNIRAQVGEQDEHLKWVQTEVRSLGVLLQQTMPATPEEREESQALYAAFEKQFRGASSEIKKRLKLYLPMIRSAVPDANILDLGCGFGDWLELLKEEGLQAQGVETNRFMVERCRKQGLEVIEDDVIVHLSKLSDNSVGAVTAFHLIEHLPFQTLIRLLDQVKRILRPGGLIILETPNPENLVVAACNFYSDPTHHKPIYAHTLTFILDLKGFTNLRLEYLHPVEGKPLGADDPAQQALHTWFYGPRDFAVWGSKN